MADEEDELPPVEPEHGLAVEEVPPEFPDHTMTDEDVEGTEFRYSIRGPNDYIVSRPTDTFRSPAHADRWAGLRFGNRYKGREQAAEEFGRYCFIVRKP